MVATNEKGVREIAKENILTTNELCTKLNITRQYVSVLVKKGKLTPFIISPGNHYYWWEPDVDELLKNNQKLFKKRSSQIFLIND